MKKPIEMIESEDKPCQIMERVNSEFSDNERNKPHNDQHLEGRASCLTQGNNKQENKVIRRKRKSSEVIELCIKESNRMESIEIKTCNICRYYLPSRAHHCKKCGKCVLRRDHHCIWLGVCIGYKNYKYFILLVYYLSLFLFLVTLFVIDNYNLLWIENKFIFIVFFLITIPELIFVLALCIFHTRLMIKNVTSLENIKYPGEVFICFIIGNL